MKIHQPSEIIADANVALSMLKEGNERYLKGELIAKDSYTKDMDELWQGQHPFAVILTCSDSRVAPEIFFDQKLGDLFVIRNAGNIADQTALGSMEYAVEHLNSKLIVVIGHSNCGAVTACVGGGDHEPDNIKSILKKIEPARAMGGDIDCVIHNHVKVMAEQIASDETIKRLGATVIGAYYDIHTGVVTWL